MRLFVGVRPPDAVLDRVAGLVADLQGSLGPASLEALRWTTRDQWHLTLRFLGEVGDPEPVIESLERAPVAAADVVLGPAATVLGGRVVCLPATGLDELAAGVVAATASYGRPPEDRPFRGHLTLARQRGRSRRPVVKRRDLDGPVIDARWLVQEVTLVRSHLGRGGSRYQHLHIRRLS